ncbi:MAG: NAD-dependent deacylase [Bacteroidetes bacterium]|nr:NAD-dependent deacylase [Bacteroidota bacterium]MDA1336594.1 NAD-dependent deacylase [Bacteroidota bacterium]
MERISVPKRLVVFTGAGMSAESGIQTFRGAGGLWEGQPVQEVATPEAWNRNPDRVLRFYNERRRQLLNSEPNLGHRILANWQEKTSVEIITQNVDDLHERAGSVAVMHLHGELMKARSCSPAGEVFQLSSWEMRSTDVCPNGYRLRPHIVWFGESVPMMDEAIKKVQSADCLVVVGTSLQVYPAAQLAYETVPGIPIHVIDPAAEDLGVPGAIDWPFEASKGLEQLDALWFSKKS